MAKAKAMRSEEGTRSARTAAPPALAPGLHAATIELAAKGHYRVRLATGERVRATLAEEVQPALADECLKKRRTVLVSPGPRGPVILGALQTSPSVAEDRGRLRIDAREIEIAAEQVITLRVGRSVVTVDERGTIRLVGEQMTARMAKALRVLAANVELP